MFPCLPSAVMEWHSMPFSLLNGIFVKALWIQPALSLKPQTVLREEKICEWNLSLQILLWADQIMTPLLRLRHNKQRKPSCDIPQDVISGSIMTYIMSITHAQYSSHLNTVLAAFHQLEPRLNFSIKHAFFENRWQLGHTMQQLSPVPGPPSTTGKEMLRLRGLWSGDMAVFA